ncbi:MAG: 7-carboxy-7-deazaguanine synthase QueE [Prosthecobacter sp.]|jgi:7-carboxy-7-deazaguanine synthase|nr:7-carboxy-7-deazaguanine synthase QueE [Prosthecobacter sp.]
MRISEIFFSIQGEGVLTGVPSVFIRTSGCNLRCSWCDTPYASWQPEGSEMTLDELLAQATRHPTRHVVITGGEPMIAKDIRTFIAALRARGCHVTVETAGTIAPAGCLVDLASLSPKLSNSTPTAELAGPAWVARHESARCQPEVLRAWIESACDYQLKFVISTERDLEEAHALVASLGIPVPPEKILLMPEGTTVEAMRSRYPLLIDACLRYGHRFSHRLHLELFGNKRGT